MMGERVEGSVTNESAKRPQSDKPKRKAPRSAWKPGISGNPKGRPSAGLSWAELILKIGNEPMPGRPDLTRKEAVVLAAFHYAMKGNAAILRELMQRSEPQPTELSVHHGWEELARSRGLTEAEVIAEAEQIINERKGHEPGTADGD